MFLLKNIVQYCTILLHNSDNLGFLAHTVIRQKIAHV